jgi:hypothetical protein
MIPSPHDAGVGRGLGREFPEKFAFEPLNPIFQKYLHDSKLENQVHGKRESAPG